MDDFFCFDSRLGIHLPCLDKKWDEYKEYTREAILLHWEMIRGGIPDRIADLEGEIIKKQDELSNEQDFSKSCILNSEIAELASIINDLSIWYRMNQGVNSKVHL